MSMNSLSKSAWDEHVKIKLPINRWFSMEHSRDFPSPAVRCFPRNCLFDKVKLVIDRLFFFLHLARELKGKKSPQKNRFWFFCPRVFSTGVLWGVLRGAAATAWCERSVVSSCATGGREHCFLPCTEEADNSTLAGKSTERNQSRGSSWVLSPL